jgi:CRP/FNR family cyclic AMP-dependent transcriptional regulator
VGAGLLGGSTLANSDITTTQVREVYEKTFAASEMIFEEGDRGDVLFVIQAGEVELTRRTLTGRHTVANLGPGEFFGEMSVVLAEPRTARATAACEVRLLQLDGAVLESMCLDRPEIGIRIIRRLTTRLIDSERRLTALGVDDLLRPVVRALVKRAEPSTGEGVRIPGTLRDLAQASGLSMLEAHHALHQLLDQKLIRLVDDIVVTNDLDSLSSSLDAAG